MLLYPSFVTFIFALSTLGTPVKRDAAQVQKDIQNMQAGTNSLDESINAFPNSGGTLPQAMAIHVETIDLGSAAKNATADINASLSFTDSEAVPIIGGVEVLVSKILETLDDLVKKKPALAPLKVDAIVEEDLLLLQKDAQAFGTALEEKSPSSTQSTIQEWLAKLNAAFENAEQTYSS